MSNPIINTIFELLNGIQNLTSIVMKKIFAVLLLFAIMMSGCSTDFDMYADYKDMTIIYALADISNDTTWVKITKAYTGPGNALLIASNPDSSNYPYRLNAVIKGKKNGVELDPIVLDTTIIHNKNLTQIIVDENGDTTILNPFYSPDQLMYYGVGNLDQDATYTLEITKNDEVVSASTNLVNDFYILKPNNRIAFSTTNDGYIEWKSAKNGKIYEVSLRFDYQEFLFNSPDYPDTLSKSVEWSLGTSESKTDEGGADMDESYSGQDFYNILEANLEPIPNIERWAGNVVITIACGSQVMATYLNINSGSASLLEEVPAYTNVDGGTGIFASRFTLVKTLELSVVTERDLIEDYDLGFKFKSK